MKSVRLNPPLFHLCAKFIFRQFGVPPQIAPHHHGFLLRDNQKAMRQLADADYLCSRCEVKHRHGSRIFA
jgi:hypothetical protein